jgi:hypothetical protein
MAMIEITKDTTAATLASDYEGASGCEWMAVSVAADESGRIDLVTFARDMACQAYEQE